MNRRELLILLAGAGLAGPHPVIAQQKAMPVIGFLGARSHNAPLTSAFQQGLSEAGYAKGRNVAIEYRWAEAALIGCPHRPPITSTARST